MGLFTSWAQKISLFMLVNLIPNTQKSHFYSYQDEFLIFLDTDFSFFEYTKPITKICVYFVPSRSVLIRKKIWSTIKKCFYKSYQEVLQFNVLLKSVNQLPLTGQKKERIWMCFLVVRYYCPTLRYSIQLKKKRSRHIGLVFL